jgi:glycosyltransferase involved in cell wall biosynthesis
VKTPVLTTIHGFSSPDILPVYRKYNKKVHYVSISNADRAPDLDYAATVYHGLPVEDFTFRSEPEDYLLFLGRISHEKGVVEAIEVGRRCGLPVKIAGIIQDETYFKERVQPLLKSGAADFLGPADHDAKNKLLGGAKALIHFIHFKEPFGFTMIEAMACGTPVIARGLGSVPEVVDDRETGYVVSTLDGAVKAVAKLSELDRVRIRRVAEDRWAVQRMVRDYLRVYEGIL